MRKKLILLMLVIPVSLVFYSCLDYSLPKKIGLEVEGSIDLPVKTATSNFGAVIARALEKNLSGKLADGLTAEIYNVNYGQNAQAFCAYLSMEMSKSLNPTYYLNKIEPMIKLKDLDSLEIDKSIKIPSFEDFECTFPVSYTLPISLPPGVPGPVSVPISEIPIPINIPSIPLGSSIGDYFLHALIEEGNFTIELDMPPNGNVTLGKFTTTYEIGISQDNDVSSPGGPYSGLDRPPVPSTSTVDLTGKHINGNQVTISGKIILRPESGYVTIKDPEGDKVLEGLLEIKLNLEKFAELDLNFSKMDISDELQPRPVSLKDVAEYLNYIEFDECGFDEKGELNAGIGINLNLTEMEIADGLAMSVSCPDLEFSYVSETLREGNNVFGNKDFLHLPLAGYKDDAEKLEFEITLLPAGGDPDVLHLKNQEVGKKTLRIKGEAELFRLWKRAEVNMKKTLKAAGEDGVFDGTFPDEKEKPIDLKFLDDYIQGFQFNNIKAYAYLTGPNKTVEELDAFKPLLIEMSHDGKSSVVMEQEKLTLTEKRIVIANYLDDKGSYKQKELPLDGNEFNFTDAIDTRPDDLIFHYNIKIKDEIVVEPYMFPDDDDAAHEITAAVLLLIHMEMTAGDDGGWIKHSDMFKGQSDLFGRVPDANDPSRPEKNSMFTSLDVGYISFAVDFSGSFFSGGTLFLEKKADENKPLVLFPYGIPVNGNRISADINSYDFDRIKNNFITPDFMFKFDKGGIITIPRNIGLTSISIAAKGKNSFELDFDK